MLFHALVGLWGFFLVRGEFETARDLASQGLRVAQQTCNPAFLLEAHVGLGLVLYYQGNLAAAHSHLELAAELTRQRAEKDRLPSFFQDSGVASLTYGALVLWHLGLLEQARARMAEALALARQLSHPFSLAFALNHAAGLFMLLRDRYTFRTALEEATTYALAQGFPLWVGLGTAVGGWEFIEQEQAAEGIARVRRGLTMLEATGTQLGKTFFLLLLADAYRRAGQADEGFVILSDTNEYIQKTGERLYEAEFLRLHGELTLEPEARRIPNSAFSARSRMAPPSGAEGAAKACFLQAISVARQQEAKSLELRAALALARLWKQQGKWLAARKVLAESYGRFTEGFEFSDLKEAKTLLAGLGT